MKQKGSDNPQITPLGGPAIGGRREQRVPRRIATLDVTPSGGRTLYTLNAADGSDAQAVHLGGLQFVPGRQPRGGGDGDDHVASPLAPGSWAPRPSSRTTCPVRSRRMRA
jgi:hypothetical protein